MIASNDIPLTRGLVATVDAEDFSLASTLRWIAVPAGDTHYASTRIRDGGRTRTVYLHRILLGLCFGDRTSVDHVNGNGLDNRRVNLRACGHQQNLCNQRRSRANTSGYKGVYRRKNRVSKPWAAQIKVKGQRFHIGHFATLEDAARAYDEAAVKHFGAFARLNFPLADATCAAAMEDEENT